jgi:hypothetical protein
MTQVCHAQSKFRSARGERSFARKEGGLRYILPGVARAGAQGRESQWVPRPTDVYVAAFRSRPDGVALRSAACEPDRPTIYSIMRLRLHQKDGKFGVIFVFSEHFVEGLLADVTIDSLLFHTGRWRPWSGCVGARAGHTFTHR